MSKISKNTRSFKPHEIITDDITGIKAEILGPKDKGSYPVLLWNQTHIPTLGRLKSLPKNESEQDDYAEKMRAALKDSWREVMKKKPSPNTRLFTLKSGREIKVTTVKNDATGKYRKRKASRKRRKRGGVTVPRIGIVPLGGLCDVNEDCQLGLQCRPDPSYIIDTIKTCRERDNSRKRRTKRKSRKRKSRKRRKSRRKSRRRKRRTKRRR
jgi:hypothetical protein